MATAFHLRIFEKVPQDAGFCRIKVYAGMVVDSIAKTCGRHACGTPELEKTSREERHHMHQRCGGIRRCGFVPLSAFVCRRAMHAELVQRARNAGDDRRWRQQIACA